MDVPQDLRQFNSLVQLIASLRGPSGCPWDREQTHESLREHLLEESYEVLEALDNADSAKLCSELGDLLLQVVLHAQVSKEVGGFDMGDVIESVSRKLIYRHPHVFSSGCGAKDADEVLVRWEELKKKERKDEDSMLDGVPKILPALAYSQSVQDRVARVGFDWSCDDAILDKLAEEIAEVKEVTAPHERAVEFGDVLFTLSNYARHQDIDLESALRESNHKFYRRFSYMEKLCCERKLNLSGMTPHEKNALWNEAKAAVD
ncbi:MAG: nucleoside triphosphate pyrophosphohydrolase [Dehalococcoidia bacterium]|nr:nucleoside triphosphate pyrophosphohydrolase [Dehalococcoidia bacterium]